MPLRFWIFGLLFEVCTVLAAQTSVSGFAYTRDIPLRNQGDLNSLPDAWTGGLNAPQLYTIDLDGDSQDELLLFDRSGNVWLPFRYQSENRWIFEPQLRSCLPNPGDWVVIRDYNNDAKPDLFCSANNGISVYKNNGFLNGCAQFELIASLLESDYGNGNLNLYVSRVDLPAIDDVDGDGDLDILTFYILGTCVEYHRNMRVETNGNPDDWAFKLESNNWGLFTENLLDNGITLNDSCGRFASGERHSGSTLLLSDVDLDGDPDLLLGDVSFPEVRFLINQPQNGFDRIIETPSNYPNEWNAIGVDLFPGSFPIDANRDGITDLAVAPNTNFQALNNGRNLWIYPGVEDAPFRFTGNGSPFLVDQSLDFGRNSFPHLADLDGDGDLDLLVGHGGAFEPSGIPNVDGNYRASLWLYENTGTAQNPFFEFRTNDLLNLAALNLKHIAPCAGNLNGDSRPDLIIGLANGTFLWFTASPGVQPFLYNQGAQSALPCDAGDEATPYLWDANGDGKTDLISGCKQGYFRLFLNSGSSSTPQFSITASEANWGQMETIEEGISNYGYSTPNIFSKNDKLQIFSGSERGVFFQWEWDEAGSEFQLLDSIIGFIDEGKRTAPTLGDLNLDGKADLISGNERGGLTAYWGAEPTKVESVIGVQALQIHPNPNAGQFRITGFQSKVLTYQIFDTQGRRLIQGQTNGNTALSTDLPSGLYMLCIEDAGVARTLRLLISR